MTMPPVTKDVLFRAILALDVFNRGYNAPVLWTPDATTPGIPTSLGIGLATLKKKY